LYHQRHRECFHNISIISLTDLDAERLPDIWQGRWFPFVLCDWFAQRIIRDPGSGSRRFRDRDSHTSGMLDLGCQKREEHGFGVDKIRPHCGCARHLLRALYRLQHEPGAIVRTGTLEQSMVTSLDLLVRSDRRCPDHLLRVQSCFRHVG